MSAERTAWLAERRTGIGSSDAAAVCGLSAYRTPLHVYLDKTQPADEPEPEDGPLYWGLRLEDVIAAEYTRRTGLALLKPALLRSADWHWMLASCDRLTLDGTRVVELKNYRFGSEGWGPEGTDQVPPDIMVQGQHQLAVTGCRVASVAVLLGGNEFRIYEIPRSDELINRLLVIEEGFWLRVASRDPPPPDWWHPETPRLLDRLHRPVLGRSVEFAEPADAELLRRYLELGEAERLAAKERERVKGELVERMADAAVAYFPCGSRVTRTAVRRRAYSVAESESVRFLVHKPKEQS